VPQKIQGDAPEPNDRFPGALPGLLGRPGKARRSARFDG